MKKNILFKILLLLGITICNSQTKYGLKGGLNYSNNVTVNTDSEANNYLTSFNMGLFLKRPLNEKLNINTEILFSRKGYKIEADPNTTPSSEGSLQLDYINLPILIEYRHKEKIGFEAGGEFGYLISANSKFESNKIDISHIWDNKFDIGLVLGLNYLLSEKFFINFRYIHGLTSVIKDVKILTDPSNEPENSDIKFLNRTFQLSLNYIIQ